MHAQSTIRLLLCLLIAGAHFHCVMAHGAALISEVEATRATEPPIGETTTCENESSCICKGALISVSLPPLLDHGDLTDWLPLPTQALDCDLVVDADPIYVPPGAIPLLSGAAARIVLQSFQL